MSIQQVEDKDMVKEEFRKDVVKLVIKIFTLLYFVSGIAISVAIVSKELGSKTNQEYVIYRSFYQSIAGVISLFKLLNTGLLIYTRYVNYKKRNCIIFLPMENVVLYVVMLPISALAILYMIFATIYNFKFLSYFGPNFILTLTDICFFISIVVQLSDFGSILNTGEHDHLNLINRTTLLVTLIAMVNIIIYEIVTSQLDSFRISFFKVLNISLPSDINPEKEKIISNAAEFIRPVVICFGVLCVCYLIGPVKRHLIDIVDIEQAVNKALRKKMVKQGKLLINKSLSYGGLIGGVVMVVMAFIALQLCDSLNIINRGISQSNCTECRLTCGYILIGFRLHIYVYLMFLAVIQFYEIKYWKKKLETSIVDQAVLWIGFIGKISATFNRFLSISGKFYGINGEMTKFYSMRIIDEFFSFIYTVFITVLIDCLLKRKETKRKINKSTKLTNPIFGSFCGNISMTILLLLNLNDGTNSLIAGETLPITMTSLTIPVEMIYHLYLLISLARLLKYD